MASSAAKDPAVQASQTPAAVRVAPVRRATPPTWFPTQTVLATQFPFPAAQKSVAHVVQVSSASDEPATTVRSAPSGEIFPEQVLRATHTSASPDVSFQNPVAQSTVANRLEVAELHVYVAEAPALAMTAQATQLPELRPQDPVVQTAQTASTVTEAVFVAVRAVLPSDCLPEEKKKEERN